MIPPAAEPRPRVAGLVLDDAMVRVVVLESVAVVTDPTDRADGAEGADGAAPAEPAELSVVEVAEADLAPGLVRDGRVMRNAALGARLGQLWRELGLGGVRTFLGLQPTDTWVETFSLDWSAPFAQPPELGDAVQAMRARYGEEPAWCFGTARGPATRADIGPDQVVGLRLLGCRREDLSAASWAARRSGIWVAGVAVTASGVAGVMRPPPGGGLVLIDSRIAGTASVTLVAGSGSSGPQGLLASRRVPAALGRAGSAAVSAAAVDEPTMGRWVAALAGDLEEASRVALVLALADQLSPGPLGVHLSAGLLAGCSPRPVDGCLDALGLALAAGGAAPWVEDLQRSMLHGGSSVAGLLRDQLSTASRSTPDPPGAGPAGAAQRPHGNHRQPSTLLAPRPPDAATARSVGLFRPKPVRVRPAAAPVAQEEAAPRSELSWTRSMGHDVGPAWAWVHRPGLRRGQPHVAVLDGSSLEFRGTARDLASARQARRAAARIFGDDWVTGRLEIDPDAHPDAVAGVRWSRRFGFEPGDAELLPAHDALFDELFDLLSDFPQVGLVIEGHSDAEGELATNLRLSRARAVAVAEVLLAGGVDPVRLRVFGRGPFAPLAPGDSEIVRALHRRVEVTFLGLLD